MAESVGGGRIITGGRSYTPRQATAFDAEGTIIETETGAHQAYVYSNGSGLFVDGDTRVEINQFAQEPFLPARNDYSAEPSISRSNVFVARGQIGICTGRLVAGTTMTYSTPHAGINVRTGKLAIETSPEETRCFVIEGDATVRAGSRDLGGTLLRAGEMAVVRANPDGGEPLVSVAAIDRRLLASLNDKVNVACSARRTVTFESIERRSASGAEGESEAPGSNSLAGGDTEIVARPTVPANPPNHLAVSPARLEAPQN